MMIRSNETISNDQERLNELDPLSRPHNQKAKVKKVKVSHSLVAVGAVGVRDTLYFGHSI